MSYDVTVAIPSIPVRSAMLRQAVTSAATQTAPAAAISVAVDVRREGAALTRQRALEAVRTPWTAFLDDDDVMLPGHLERLTACARETGADYVFSWFNVLGGTDPFPQHFGKPWSNAEPRQTTITVLVRTDLAKAVGFKPVNEERPRLVAGQRWGEDYEFTLGCMAAGARIVHLPERTWVWRHHGRNTSGRPDRW